MKPKENKRMTSIAKRINRSQSWSLLWSLVLMDIVVLGAAVLGWAYYMERSALGSAWVIGLQRQLQWPSGQPFLQALENIRYSFALHGQAPTVVSAGEFMHILKLAALNVGAAQALLVVLRYFSGKRRTMRLLSPLHQMSDAAAQLSRIRFDEQKYHDLEDAIAALSPASPDVKLATGDSDLQGLETAINQLLGRMHDNYRQQTRFVSDASHELRTPISVLRGYAEMLDRWGKNDPKVLNESITAIRTEADNMQQLVEQLLFLARGDAGRNRPKLQPLDLQKLVQEVHEEYEMIDQQHSWRLNSQGPVPAVGDPQQLKQVMRILCDNAMKYSGDGGTITLRSYVDEQDMPCLSVQDNGVGIGAKDLPHIFERFYRADPARARHSGGSGLGLSIARWVVDQHKGYIQVVSHEGLGTRMTVCLPVQPLPKQGSEDGSASAPQPAGRQPQPVS